MGKKRRKNMGESHRWVETIGETCCDLEQLPMNAGLQCYNLIKSPKSNTASDLLHP